MKEPESCLWLSPPKQRNCYPNARTTSQTLACEVSRLVYRRVTFRLQTPRSSFWCGPFATASSYRIWFQVLSEDFQPLFTAQFSLPDPCWSSRDASVHRSAFQSKYLSAGWCPSWSVWSSSGWSLPRLAKTEQQACFCSQLVPYWRVTRHKLQRHSVVLTAFYFD